MLNIHFSRVADLAAPDHIVISPSVPISCYRDGFGNWCSRILAPAGHIAAFPLLSRIEAITVLGEIDDGGANHRAAQACAARWIGAGREALMVAPLVGGDLNDVWREVAS